MKKTDLIAFLQTEARSEEVCEEIVDAVFEKLREKVSLDVGLTVDGIGYMGAHLRKGASKELVEEGKQSHNKLSIFFHPSKEIKREVKKHVEET